MDSDVKGYDVQKKALHRAVVYMTAAMQASLSYCSWLMLAPKNVLVHRLIIIAHALQRSDPPDKGLWGGLVGGQGC